jgi:hypothetical protein
MVRNLQELDSRPNERACDDVIDVEGTFIWDVDTPPVESRDAFWFRNDGFNIASERGQSGQWKNNDHQQQIPELFPDRPKVLLRLLPVPSAGVRKSNQCRHQDAEDPKKNGVQDVCLLLSSKIFFGFGFRFGLDCWHQYQFNRDDDVRCYKRRFSKATEQDGQGGVENNFFNVELLVRPIDLFPNLVLPGRRETDAPLLYSSMNFFAVVSVLKVT